MQLANRFVICQSNILPNRSLAACKADTTVYWPLVLFSYLLWSPLLDAPVFQMLSKVLNPGIVERLCAKWVNATRYTESYCIDAKVNYGGMRAPSPHLAHIYEEEMR
ncbi:hypothetical protein TcWFU_009959 [Taenia crassiceps]|uniref:Uncharacterized protein n=1 Tax=Taenia crassiceps TaxID=6207 RepID=A0ABR4Q9D1_9CEST